MVQGCQTGQCVQSVGDPIDAALGNESEREVDYSGGAGSPLKFVRVYNYAGTLYGPSTPPGDLGQGWTHTYERRLWLYPGGATRALRPDGTHQTFVQLSGQYGEFGTSVDQLTPIQSGGTTTGWQLTEADGSQENYDTSGNLLSINFLGGASVAMSYSTSSTPASVAPYPGLLIAVADNFSHALNFTYNAQGQIVTMTDPSGAVFEYSSSSGLLSAVQFPDSSSEQYLYNESSHTSNTNIPLALTGIIDENGIRYATINYNSGAQAVSSQLAGGVDQFTVSDDPVSVYVNQGEHEQASVTDPLGNTRTYTYAADANDITRYEGISVVCPSCSDAPAGVTYDANGNIASTTDFDGHETVYAHDLTRNLETSRTEAYGTSQARTTTTQWDSTYRLPILISEYAGGTASGNPIRTTYFSYDGSGRWLTYIIGGSSFHPMSGCRRRVRWGV
jgi:YD repeat-containing protein